MTDRTSNLDSMVLFEHPKNTASTITNRLTTSTAPYVARSSAELNEAYSFVSSGDLQVIEGLAGFAPSVAMFASSDRETQQTRYDSTHLVKRIPGVVALGGSSNPAGVSKMKGPKQLMYAFEEPMEQRCTAMLAALGSPFDKEFHVIFPRNNKPRDLSFHVAPWLARTSASAPTPAQSKSQCHPQFES